jgi:hypothetical protein
MQMTNRRSRDESGKARGEERSEVISDLAVHRYLFRAFRGVILN